MIPFARMLEYGNTARVIGVKEIQSSEYANTLFILDYDGNLYSTGQNFNGVLGNGNTADSYGVIKQVLTDVKSFMYGYNSCICIKNDNTIWCSGQQSINVNNTPDNNSFGNITSLFTGIDISKIKQIGISRAGGWFLMDDNTLYFKGRNTWGFAGDGTPVSTYVQWSVVSTDVKEFCMNDLNGKFIKIDNTIWGTGNNGGASLSSSNVNTILLRSVQMYSTIPFSDIASLIFSNNRCMLIKKNGQYIASGFNSFGNFGDGVINAGGSVPSYVGQLSFTPKDNSGKVIRSLSNSTFIQSESGDYYSTGFRGINGLTNASSGAVVGTFTRTATLPNNLVATLVPGGDSVIFHTQYGFIYMCGTNILQLPVVIPTVGFGSGNIILP